MTAAMSEFRIYGRDHDETFYALVDEIDYQWALRWKWSELWSRGHTKVYLRRVFQIIIGPDRYEDGKRIQTRKQSTVFLHREICWREHGPPPPDKPLSDHRNGDELDCRRKNLRWADAGMNARNINQNSRSLARRLGL